MSSTINPGFSLAIPPLPSLGETHFPDPPAIPDVDAGHEAFDAILNNMLQEPVTPTMSPRHDQVQETSTAANFQTLYNQLMERTLANPQDRPFAVEHVAGFTPVHKQKALAAAAGNGKDIISDDQYFNADALSPEQIDQILEEKGSPYAGRRYAEGKTAGRLIWEKVHNAGTVPQGPHTLNPAVMLGIMGAETEFGKTGWGATNPFNIRLNGTFDSVKAFEESMAIAVNTMYNAAMDRPTGNSTTYFDYAGNLYCENYRQTWKPNVEGLYREFVGEIDDNSTEKANYGQMMR